MSSSLRVLYTINSSPQYILAKSHTRVPIFVIPAENESNTDVSPLYASVLLKICLDTILRSSPELTHDTNRDFSVYVLDPLESNSAPAPVQITNANDDISSSSTTAEQTRGVAVGLGLMSWALMPGESDAMVVGTLIKQGNGQEALQVIFALRETISMERPTWNIQENSSQLTKSQRSVLAAVDAFQLHSQASTSTSMLARPHTADPTRETLTSVQIRAKAVKPKRKLSKTTRQSIIPPTESDKLMNADTYIGPLKKKGRPKAILNNKPPRSHPKAVASNLGNSSQPQDVIVIDGSDSDGAASTPTTMQNSASKKSSNKQISKKKRSSQCQYPETPPFTTEPFTSQMSNAAPPTQVKAESQDEISLLDILAYFSATSSSEPNLQNAAVITALSTIDSSNNQANLEGSHAPNPALVSALKHLLSVYAKQPPQSPEPVQSAPINSGHKSHHSAPASQDDGIVILDKENVNPITYRKLPEKDGKFSDPTSVQSSISIASTSSAHSSNHVQSLSFSARPNESISRASLNDSASSLNSDRIVRKRTLSDFMDERESGRSKRKGKERERVEKRDGHRHAQSQRIPKTPVHDALRHYPRLLASDQPRAEQPSNYYRVPLESMPMTSPARARPELIDKLVEKEFSIVGSSGFQSSSSMPRSSPPRALRVSASSPVRGIHQESRRKYTVPEWARTSTATQPRLSEEALRALENVEEGKRQEKSTGRKRQSAVLVKLKNKNSATFSNADALGQKVNSIPSHSPPPLFPKSNAAQGPITANSDRSLFSAVNCSFPFITSTRSSSPPPQPNVLPQTPKTPSRDRHLPRFTPGRESDSLFTPVMGSGNLFGSADSFSHRTPLLPTVLTSPLGNRKKAKLSPTRSLLSGKLFAVPAAWASSSSAPKLSESNNLEDGETLRKSLDRELEDALDDLPIASSDIDADESRIVQIFADAEFDDSEQVPVIQHWAGLPPSSPPTPSSPMLVPDSDNQTDEEMEDLPIATSDSETEEMTGAETDTTSPNTPSSDNLVEPCDFSSFFASAEFSATSEDIASSDLFEQFTNTNEHSDPLPTAGQITMDPEMEAIFQNGLDNIDFTEFWESFNPLVDQSMQGSQQHPHQGGENYLDPDEASFGQVDHAKLADDLQTLLSGCLM